MSLIRNAILVLTAGLMAVPAMADLKPGLDQNSDGAVSSDEFIVFMGERDLNQRDANNDGVMSTSEWLGADSGTFRRAALDKFNRDGDEEMAVSEIVDVYDWTFSNRDKNKDGFLTGKEIPGHLTQ